MSQDRVSLTEFNDSQMDSAEQDRTARNYVASLISLYDLCNNKYTDAIGRMNIKKSLNIHSRCGRMGQPFPGCMCRQIPVTNRHCYLPDSI